MTIPLVYESDPVEYEPIDLGNSHPSNPWMNIPPREYSEALSHEGAFVLVGTPLPYVLMVPTRYSPAATYGLAIRVATQGPAGFRAYLQYFDPATGDFLKKFAGPPIDLLTLAGLRLGRTFELWGTSAPDSVALIDVDTSARWIETTEAYALLSFTPAADGICAIDRPADVFLTANATGKPSGQLHVYTLSTSTWAYGVEVGSIIRHVMLEDEKRAYAICEDGLFVLVDYIAKRVMGVIRVDLSDTQPIEEKGFAWDPASRRILVCERELDDEVTGAPNTHIKGFYPIPQVVRLLTPIPLRVPRYGRRVRVITRAYGNAGEAIGGKTITATVSGGDASLRSRTVGTDAEGYATFHLVCDDDGTATIAVSAETLP